MHASLLFALGGLLGAHLAFIFVVKFVRANKVLFGSTVDVFFLHRAQSCSLNLFTLSLFLLLGGFVLLNIVVAVILETFATLAELNPELVSQADIDSFREVWGEFDPTATQMISATRLPELLLRLPPPMGLAGGGLLDGKPITATLTNARRFCLKLNCESEGGRIGFKPVLEALIEANGKSHGIAPPPVARRSASASSRHSYT